MRLTRIEAVRFGRLDQVSLGPIGEGLTVVVGPNGAGKTSFTTLVRYVLYGFPRKNDKTEPDYESSAGKRVGRVVFADETGEWIVERTEGVRGGNALVNTVDGEGRPDLLDRVTSGVSRNEFRVVFGFGLQDMADIEPGAGSGGVLSRLYAARVGLAVSPQDVRDGIDAFAANLYKARGSTPQINTITREMTAIKKRLRELEDGAAAYASQRERLIELRKELDAARVARDSTAVRRAELESLSATLGSLEERVSSADVQIRELRTREANAREQIASLAIDEELLERAPETVVLLDDVSGYRERLAALARLEARAAEAHGTAVQALTSAALDEGLAANVTLGPDSKAGIARYRDHISGARARAESAVQKLHDACDRTDIADRSAARDENAAPSVLPSAVMGAIGVVAVVLGLVLSQWTAVALGAVLVAAAAALTVFGRARGARAAGGLAPETATVELARAESERADAALAKSRSEWLEWAGPRGLLAAGQDPEAAALLASAVEEWRRAVGEQHSAQAEADALREQCDRFRDSLAGLVGQRVPSLSTACLEDVAGLAARVRELLERELQNQARSVSLEQELESVSGSLTAIAAEYESASTARQQVLDRLGLPAADSASVAALGQAARAAAVEADEAHMARAAEVARLEGELDTQGTDREMAQLRLTLAGLQERLSQAADRYVVLAAASRLVGRTQTYYENARQPEVVRRAGQVFSEITQGRYERISIPSGGGEIVAYSGTDATPCSELSRGSQEQLYLSLRIALVEQLDEVGEGLPVLMDDIFANFDPERHRGAAEAVAELARHRQVVFFTCHPQVADLFAAVEPGHVRLSLERC